MAEEAFFRVTFVRPGGWRYQLTGRASDEAQAVRRADDVLEYVERVGIADHVMSDWLTVRPPARLTVERVAENDAGSGFGLVVTDPNGDVTRK